VKTPLAIAAALAALPLVAHAADTQATSATPSTTEVTVSGGGQAQLIPYVLGTLAISAGVTMVHDESAVLEVTGVLAKPTPSTSVYSASAMGGWNHRAIGGGSLREGLAVDLRAMLGASLFAMYSGPIFGAVVAGELAFTNWFTPNVGMSVSALAGIDLVALILPSPMARISLGVTF
jgi:hypothetical protein